MDIADLAKAYAGMGQTTKIFAAFEKARVNNENNAEYFSRYGMACFDADHYEAAVSHYKVALQLAPDNIKDIAALAESFTR